MATDTSTSTARNEEEGFVPFFGQFFPESLTLAALLALVALVVTVPFLSPVTQLELFATGFFQLLTVQMALILLWVLPAAVVESTAVGRVFDAVADRLPAGSQTNVVYATGFVAVLFGWVNWALGLIGAVLVGHRLCRRAAERDVAVHYPAVLTAALLSLVVTNVGLSSPGALMMADASGTTNFLVDPEAGRLVVDVGAFLLHPVNVVSTALFLLTLPALLTVLAPSDAADRRPIAEFSDVLDGSIAETLSHYSPPPREEWVVADRLEQSPVFTVVTFALGAVSVVAHFATGGSLTLLWLLFALMMLGILVQRRPMAYVEKTREATRWANHVAVPFLLYASVYVLLSESGLYAAIGDAIAGTGVPQTVTYFLAVVLGVFVPSPGSLWVVQGPALAAAETDLVPTLVSVMYGAGVSNFLLGFLFVGLVSTVYGFDWREYLRYAAAVTGYVSVVVVALFLVF